MPLITLDSVKDIIFLIFFVDFMAKMGGTAIDFMYFVYKMRFVDSLIFNLYAKKLANCTVPKILRR